MDLIIASIIAYHCSVAKLDVRTCLDICWCESAGNYEATNPNSSSRGLYQIIKSTQAEVERRTNQKYEVFNPVDNTKMAVWLMKKYGTSPWNSSKKCWKGRKWKST